MKYVVFETKYPMSSVWAVEAFDGDGHSYVAHFLGHDALERALEYAKWKNGESDVDR